MSNNRSTPDNKKTKGSIIDKAKRSTLKTIGATTASIAAAAPSVGIAGNEPHTTSSPVASNANKFTAATSGVQHLSINIQKNQTGLDDWVLIENMTEEPLVARCFEPRFVQYNNTVLDLNALLSRQQRGKEQLELWPNHAWTHSTRNATRGVHALRPAAEHIVKIDNETRSVQFGAQVDDKGRVCLTSVNA